MSKTANFTPENLAGKRIERALTRAFSAVDEESRTVELAFASNEPVQEYFGKLILDMSASSVRLERMNNGAPLTVNHNLDDQVGVVVKNSTTLDKDGLARCTVRFSRSARGEEIMQDVKDEIREGVSFLAIVHKAVLECEDETGCTYRALDWEPYEVTIAAVPKDINAGVGRSLDATDSAQSNPDLPNNQPAPESEAREENSQENQEENLERTMPDTTSATNTPAPAQVTENTISRAQEMIEFGKIFAENGGEQMARDFIAEGKSLEDLRRSLHDARRAAATNPPAPKPLVELSEKETKQYSIARAILADANLRDGKNENSFELEISEQIRRGLAGTKGIEQHGGIYVPTNIQVVKRAGLDTASATKGQTTVYTEFGGSLIELLRNKAKVILLGATVLPGLVGNVSFPRQTGAGTFSWVGENPGADVAESNATLDQVMLSPKTGQSTTSYSRQLLAQASIDVDSFVSNDLAQINALAIDRAAIHGTGASNQPEGIYAASGINSVAFGGSVSFAKLVDMETEIETDNADLGTMAYLTTPSVKGKAKQTAELANTINQAIWRDGEMNGYRAESSNQVSKTMGAGSNEHGIVLGVWSELLVGEWGAMEIITDPYAKKKQGMIEVTSFVLVDIKRRHDEAFCKGTGLIP